MIWSNISRFIRKHEDEIEYQLINFIFALIMCNIFLVALRLLVWAGVIVL